MTPYKFAQRYWYPEVPIVSKNNEITRWEPVRISKYRLARKLSGKDEPEKYDADTTNFLAEFSGKFSSFNK